MLDKTLQAIGTSMPGRGGEPNSSRIRSSLPQRSSINKQIMLLEIAVVVGNHVGEGSGWSFTPPSETLSTRRLPSFHVAELELLSQAFDVSHVNASGVVVIHTKPRRTESSVYQA
jgi:hypothetical protein